MAFHYNPIKKEINLRSLFKFFFPGHSTAVAMGYSVKFSLGDIIFSISTTKPPIFPQMPIKYHPKHFILIYPYFSSFLFVCIWNGADILFTREHREVNSLIDWHYQAVRHTLQQVKLLFLCCCLTNFNRESDVLLPGRATIQAGNGS